MPMPTVNPLDPSIMRLLDGADESAEELLPKLLKKFENTHISDRENVLFYNDLIGLLGSYKNNQHYLIETVKGQGEYIEKLKQLYDEK